MQPSSIEEDLILSLMAVNNYSLMKVYVFRDSMRAQGLFDIEMLSNTSIPNVIDMFLKAGFDRGGFNPILAERLIALARQLSETELLKVREYVTNNQRVKADELLIRFRGVGPVVLENFWNLQDSEDAKSN